MKEGDHVRVVNECSYFHHKTGKITELFHSEWCRVHFDLPIHPAVTTQSVKFALDEVEPFEGIA
jgi:hypothetical protein